jgi:hypothetical protein
MAVATAVVSMAERNIPAITAAVTMARWEGRLSIAEF